MDNAKTHDILETKDQVAVASFEPLPAPRGRPPRSRKEVPATAMFPEEQSNLVSEIDGANLPPAPTRINGRPARVGRGRVAGTRAVNHDKPIFTLSVAAEILHLHPRTLRIYEEHNLVVPTRTQTNRRRYSQNDIKKFQFIQYLTRERGVNLSGVKIILVMLDEIRKVTPDPIRQVFPDYGETDEISLF